MARSQCNRRVYVTRSFNGKTADEAWRLSVQALLDGDNVHVQPSRLGPTREILHATFSIRDPRQRWVLSRTPAINPAFAIAEVIWILLGRRDAAFLNFWNPALPRFAGSEDNYHGAYGYRLREHLGFDQIERAFQVLSSNPDSRQLVLQIWDGRVDLPYSSGMPLAPDIPCNICAMPKIRDGKLEWFQVMRSNDLFLGTPHNFVQFTTLQEILAGWLGVEVGEYVQVSDSMHCYEKDLKIFASSVEPIIAHNTDSLALPKAESERAIAAIGTAMDKLRLPELTPSGFSACLDQADLPEGYQNMLLIAAADAARRNGWADKMATAVDGCTNPALTTAWYRWEQRMNESE